MPTEALPVSGAGGGGPPLSDAAPLNVGVTAPGTSPNASRADHVHAHGNQAGGTLHAAVVSGGAAGFMSGADKAKLDALAPQGLGTFVTPPMAGWGWTNQGAASVVPSADGTAFTLIKPPNGANSIDFSLYTRPIPASRRVSAAFRTLVGVSMFSGQIPSAGMCLLDSVSGKFVVVSLLVDGSGSIGPGMWARKYTNVNLFAADYLAGALSHWQDLTRLRMFNGSAGVELRTAEWGLDGELWLPTPVINTLWDEFCVPDRIGFALDGYGVAANTTLGSMLKVLSWDESP